MVSEIRQKYNDQGYVVIRAKDKEHLKLAQECATWSDKLLDDSKGFKRGFRSADGKFKHLKNPELQIPCFLGLMQSKEVGDFLKAAYGKQRVYVTHSKISYKRKGTDQHWEPHQDSAYHVRHRRITTIPIFLCDTDAKNGALQIWPESHKLGKLKHRNASDNFNKDPQLVLDEEVPMKPVTMKGKLGDFSPFHFDAIHGGGPNTIGGNRPYFIFEVAPFDNFVVDASGKIPTILNGRLSAYERAVSSLIGLPKMAMFKARGLLGKIAG